MLREPPAYEPESPLASPTMQGWLDGDIGEITDQQAEAAVRDIDPTITVLLVQMTESHTARLLSSPAADQDRAYGDIRLDEKPDDGTARRIAAQSLSLPRVFCIDGKIDHTISELKEMDSPFRIWQESSLLHGQLFLPLDTSATCRLSGKLLKYTAEYGLEIITEDTHE